MASPSVLGIHALWRHLLHLWLAQTKPGWYAKACSRQAKSAIDGATRCVCTRRLPPFAPSHLWAESAESTIQNGSQISRSVMCVTVTYELLRQHQHWQLTSSCLITNVGKWKCWPWMQHAARISPVHTPRHAFRFIGWTLGSGGLTNSGIE